MGFYPQKQKLSMTNPATQHNLGEEGNGSKGVQHVLPSYRKVIRV